MKTSNALTVISLVAAILWFTPSLLTVQAELSETALQSILTNSTHKLTFEMQSDPKDKSVVYVLDGHTIGSGTTGLETLRTIIPKMKQGDIIGIVALSETDTKYPFDFAELSRFCRNHGINLAIPAKPKVSKQDSKPTR